jgi:hypothetical protein
MKSCIHDVVITKIWVVGVGSSVVISPGYLIESADNSSTNTPGGTFALSDPNFARMSAAIFESRRTCRISNP